MREHLERLQEHTGTKLHPTGAIETREGNLIPAIGHGFLINSKTGLIAHGAQIWNEKKTRFDYTASINPPRNHRSAGIDAPEAPTGEHSYTIDSGKIGVSYAETEPSQVRRKNLTEFLGGHYPAPEEALEVRNHLIQNPHIATVWHRTPETGFNDTVQRFNLKTGKFEQD